MFELDPIVEVRADQLADQLTEKYPFRGPAKVWRGRRTTPRLLLEMIITDPQSKLFSQARYDQFLDTLTIGVDFSLFWEHSRYAFTKSEGVGSNGNGTFRTDQGSWSGRNLNTEAMKEKDGHVFGLQINGINKNYFRQTIHPDIRFKLGARRCALCGTGTAVQVDHKDGRKDDGRLADLEAQRPGDFQWLCTHCNCRKREICTKRCTPTNKRFDAREMGFPVGWFAGGEDYKRTCIGCFWHDVHGFRSRSSKHSIEEQEGECREDLQREIERRAIEMGIREE